LVRLPETNFHRVSLDLAGMGRTAILLLRSPAFIGFALCSACTSASWFTFIAAAPQLLAHALGEPPSTYGLMILLPMAAYMLGNAAAARFALRFGSLALVVCGRVLAFAAAVAMALWWLAAGLDVWVLFVPIALSSIGDGLSQPSAMAAGLSIYPRLAGTASGLMGFTQMIVAALGTYLVGLLPYDSAFGTIIVVGGFIALGLVFGIFAVRQPASGGLPITAAVPAAADGS
jgi:MFS transporter, DHA1 family, multidrug resistance protein